MPRYEFSFPLGGPPPDDQLRDECIERVLQMRDAEELLEVIGSAAARLYVLTEDDADPARRAARAIHECVRIYREQKELRRGGEPA